METRLELGLDVCIALASIVGRCPTRKQHVESHMQNLCPSTYSKASLEYSIQIVVGESRR